MSCLVLLCIALVVSSVDSAALGSDDIQQEGLYSASDHVVILGNRNFDKKVYGAKQAMLVQFYNSYCGHCRAFAPKYKSFAEEIRPWQNVVQLAVIDCSVEQNNALCRDFEIMAYPSLRYFHENFQKGNANLGDSIKSIESIEALRSELVLKLRDEQGMGRLSMAPPLGIASYDSYAAALSDVPTNVIYTFLVFENVTSTVGSELIFDTNEYLRVRVKRVFDTSELANLAGISHFPGLVAVKNTLESDNLTPKISNRANLLNAINTYLKSKNYVFPSHVDNIVPEIDENNNEVNPFLDSDAVYYDDLEKTLKTILNTEVPRYKILQGEPLQALLNLLDVLIGSYPFRANGRDYIMELRDTLLSRPEWKGKDVYDLVKRLESKHAPVYISSLEYVRCRGSHTQYRGYSCGLWTLFHTLTVSASQLPGSESPRVLRAMHGYIKNFFGCSDCQEHFLAMSKKDRIFDVKDNDKAILWLWIAHNQVNLRLAGDPTEDPEFPKIQYPSVSACGECRLTRGAWNLPAVLRYLSRKYNAASIRDVPPARSSAVASPSAPGPLSNLDLGMLSLLYILSLIILILVIKLFLTKRFYRKRIYKHDGWGRLPSNLRPTSSNANGMASSYRVMRYLSRKRDPGINKLRHYLVKVKNQMKRWCKNKNLHKVDYKKIVPG